MPGQPISATRNAHDLPWQGKRVLLLAADDQADLSLRALFRQGGADLQCLTDLAAARELLWAELAREQPDECLDLVILDTSLSEEALPLIEEFKANEQASMMPVLCLTPPGQAELKSACINAGSDDFVTWPANEVLLYARVNALLRMAAALRQQSRQRRELDYFQSMVEREQEVARNIFNSVIRRDLLDVPHLRYSLTPMAGFSGDMLLAARTPEGNEHLLLGDFTGHGLVASIGTLPASEIFYAMTAKGFGIVEIVAEINRRLRKLLPVGMFMATFAAEVAPRSSSMTLWSGGIPEMLLRRANGEMESYPARHLALGVLDTADMEFDVDIISLEPGDRFYIYSDGITEAENPLGEMYGSEALRRVIAEAEPGRIYDTIFEELELFRDGCEQTDDVTLLEYHFDRDAILGGLQALNPQGGAVRKVSTEWSLRLRLEPHAIRSFDPRPVITQLLMDVQGLYAHRERLYTILTELFSNALDHGLLQLDSGLRHTPEGFNTYFQRRRERLEQLQQGYIVIDLQHFPSDRGGLLRITVEDSGDGYDIEAVSEAVVENEALAGIPLVRRLCKDLTIYPPGNRVSVNYQWLFD